MSIDCESIILTGWLNRDSYIITVIACFFGFLLTFTSHQCKYDLFWKIFDKKKWMKFIEISFTWTAKDSNANKCNEF